MDTVSFSGENDCEWQVAMKIYAKYLMKIIIEKKNVNCVSSACNPKTLYNKQCHATSKCQLDLCLDLCV